MSQKSPHDDIEDEAFQTHLIVVEDEEQEAPRVYSCKNCDKQFLSKQALCGHQNAHRIGPKGKGPLGSRKIEKNTQLGQNSNEFFNRAMMNMPYMMPYALVPPCHFPGNEDYQRPSNMENRHQCVCFSSPRGGTTSSFQRPIIVRDVIAENNNVQKNGRETQEVDDDSGLDLTLKL